MVSKRLRLRLKKEACIGFSFGSISQKHHNGDSETLDFKIGPNVRVTWAVTHLFYTAHDFQHIRSVALYFIPRAWGSGRTSLTSGSALGLWTSTVTNCCLDPGEEVGEDLVLDAGLRDREGGGGGAGSGGGGGGEGDGAVGLVPLLGDCTLGKGPMLCWVTVDNWADVVFCFLANAEGSLFLIAAYSWDGSLWRSRLWCKEGEAGACPGSLPWFLEAVAVKYKPECEDSEEGHLLSGSLLLGPLCTPGGGGGLKEGGDSAVADWTSSWSERIYSSSLIRGVTKYCSIMCCD